MEEELPPLENLLEGVLTDELEFLKELGEESLNDEDELPPRKDGDFGSTGVFSLKWSFGECTIPPIEHINEKTQ